MPKRKLILIDADDCKNTKQCCYELITCCPSCDHAIDPQPQGGFFVKDDYSADPFYPFFDVYILFLCTNCRNIFMVKYRASCDVTSDLYTSGILAISPHSNHTTEFSGAISKISPMFVKVYHQAEQAEQQSLLEIAGCGYRKSLEYLVKDRLCQKLPDEAEAIKSEFLGKSIKRLDDKRIQTLAERAVWIGNDETHYVREHEDLDIEDMKRFISALVHYIDCELTFEEALSIPSAR